MAEKPNPADVTLRSRIRVYLAARSMTRGEQNQFGYAVGRFERFLGRPATLADLNVLTVNEWLASLQEEGLKPRTVKNNRGRVLSLWNDALDEGVIDNEPRRLRKVKVPRWIPVAWSAEEVNRLLGEARKLRGRFLGSRVERAAFFEAMILVMWDTALRLGDVLELSTATVRRQSIFRIVQSKTNDIVVCQLRPETLAAIERTYPPERERVFGDALSRGRVIKWFRRIVDRAALDRADGSTRMVRRASATAIEALHPGAAMRHLGHRTPGLAYKHYVDPRFISEAKPLMPALGAPAASQSEEVFEVVFDDEEVRRA